jgi:hypothetical protein
MRISEEFPSNYLKAADLQGREVRVTMGHVEREKIGSDNKLVLYFKGKEKGVVLNKTNAATVSDAYGDDTEDWYDQPLILFSVKTDYQGKVVDAIRCRVPTARDQRQVHHRQADPVAHAPRPTATVRDDAGARLDEEIPF